MRLPYSLNTIPDNDKEKTELKKTNSQKIVSRSVENCSVERTHTRTRKRKQTKQIRMTIQLIDPVLHFESHTYVYIQVHHSVKTDS